MPKAFEDCVKGGGKVRTKNLKGNKYIRICYDKNGNSHAGEIMTRKDKSKEEKTQDKVNDSKTLAESLLKLKAYYNEHYHE
jgi:hypothetical protein